MRRSLLLALLLGILLPGGAAVFTERPCRAQPALANGKLYARDGKRLVCFNVQK